MVARWMPDPTPLEAIIAASVRLETMEPVKPAPAPAPSRPQPAAPPLMVGSSRHPAAIAAQDRRRIAAQARRTAEANEAKRRRAHRLALEASMEAARAAEEE